MSMVEMPGGPRLDYYYGRGIVGIAVNNRPDTGDARWLIKLSGGVEIRNYDEEIESPLNSMTGMKLVGATFSELETKLLFMLGTEKQETITLNPVKYSISDPNMVGGETFPQRPPELDEEASENDSEGTDDEGKGEGQAEKNEG